MCAISGCNASLCIQYFFWLIVRGRFWGSWAKIYMNPCNTLCINTNGKCIKFTHCCTFIYFPKLKPNKNRKTALTGQRRACLKGRLGWFCLVVTNSFLVAFKPICYAWCNPVSIVRSIVCGNVHSIVCIIVRSNLVWQNELALVDFGWFWYGTSSTSDSIIHPDPWTSSSQGSPYETKWMFKRNSAE